MYNLLTRGAALLLIALGGAVAQTISVSNFTYDFESVSVGGPGMRLPYGIQVLNTGSTPLSLNFNTGTSNYEVINSCPVSLAPGEGCFVDPLFFPPGTGSFPDSLTISYGVGIQTIGLIGEGVEGEGSIATVENTSVNFGVWGLGSTNPFGAQAVLQSVGAAPLLINSITISPSDFTITSNDCPVGGMLNPGDTCTVNFTVTAKSLGNTTGTLSFVTDSIGGTQVVNLAYTGVSANGPVLSRPAAIFDETFNGGPLLGTASAPVQGYIVNSGSAPLELSSIAVTSGFLQVNDCGSTLAPGAACLVLPAIVPSTPEAIGGALTITSNDPLSPHIDALSGFGQVAEDGGDPQLSPLVLNFAVLTGTTSPAQTITLSNQGGGGVDTSQIVVSSPDSGNFVQTNNCPSTLDPSNQCSINVTFSSSVPGKFIGVLSVQDDLGGTGEQDILLSATAQACIITPAPTAITINQPGGTANFQVTASNAGCGWTAVSNSNFITILSGATGTGSGTVSFHVDANTGFAARMGTITVAGQAVTITQAGMTENLSVSTSFVTFTSSGSAPAPQTVTVSAIGPPISVQATATSDANWLSVSPGSTTTPAIFTLSVNPSNLAPGSYVGSVGISGSGANGVTVAVQLTIEPPVLVTTGVTGMLTLVEAGTSGMFSGSVPLITNFAGTAFTAGVSGPAGIMVTPTSGSLPALLNVSIDASNLPPGNYQGQLSANIPGANLQGTVSAHDHAVNSSGISVPIAFTVPAPLQNLLTVDSSGLTFALPNATPQASRQVLVGNSGSVAINFTASADQPWIQVSSGGTTTSLHPVPLSINLNLQGFAPGTYSGNVSISAASPTASALRASADPAPIVVPVHVAVSGPVTGVTVSQTGLTFQAVAGGPAPPAQSFRVLTAGTNAASYQVSASTLSGGGWLSASGGGSTDTAPSVGVSVNPSGLAAGTYYGLVTVSSQGTPQVLTIVLNVLARGSTLGAVVEPVGLIFVSTPASPNPAGQLVSISNRNTSPIHFLSAVFFDTGSNWFSANPASGQIAPGATQQVTVTATPVSLTGSLAPGVYTGRLVIGFDNNTVQTVEVLLVVAGSNSTAASSTKKLTPHAVGCAPSKLLPVFSTLGQGFSVPAGWPQAVSVNVVDDCGNPMTAGAVTASFSDGDPSLSLLSLDTGVWTSTWTVQAAAAQSTITATAQMQLGGGTILTGTTSITGSGQTNAGVPIVATGGIVNAASFAKNATLAPGALVTVFGSSLSQQTMSAQALPLPKQLGDVSVVIGGAQVPLLYASSGQVNAVLPFELKPNSTQQLLVIRGSAVSTPTPITISTAEPAIFSADGSGGGQGIVFGVTADGTQSLADAQHPVSAGEAVVIYAAGLGALNPPVPDGAAAPTSPLSKVTVPVTVTIGGKNAIVSYAGVVPGFASLYQINAVVPGGLAAGTAIPLIVTIDNQTNPPVTIAVQ